MRAIVCIFILSILILSGCARKSDNVYQDVGEIATTREIKEIPQQKTEKATENNDTIDKENIKFYIDDSHFYDNEEGIDFAGFDETNEKYHVKILDAYTSDNLEDFGEYFSSDKVKGILESRKNFCIDMGWEETDITYLCVKIEITNNSTENAVLPMSQSFKWVSRINDERGQEFGLVDMRVESTSPSTELRYDSAKKENEGKQYYFLSLPAGETETTNCVYIFSKKLLNDDLYFELHWDKEEYNNKYHCTFPPTAETTKFLKINLRESCVENK